MRVVLLVAALLALSAAVDVSARRIHKLKQVLDAANAEEADLAVALPFDGDYWQAVKPDVSKALAAEAKKPQLSTSDLLNRFFSAENIQLAQQQGATVQAKIATYSAVGVLKACNEGTCDDKWTAFEMTGNLFAGGDGNVWLTCTVPTDLKTAVCSLSLYYGSPSNTFFTCPTAGVAGAKCGNPRAQRYSSGAGAWMSQDVIINTAAPNSALQDVYITKDALTLNYKFFGLDSNKKLTFTTIFVQSSNWAAYKPVQSPAQPAPAPELVKAQKAKVLDTAALLKKFFTAENILLAQQQGATVQSKIGTYTAAAITRQCRNGLCGEYTPYEMTGNLFSGGEGNVWLTCNVPADLTKATCDLAAYYGSPSNTLFTCPNVGAGGKCTNPRPQRYSSGAGAWMSNDFITTTVEIAEQFFTADQMVVHFRYRGIDSNKVLVFADYTFQSSNFAAYQYITQPAQPAPAAELVKAQKTKVLDTAGILKKFFTAENIQLAQQQGANVLVQIGTYAASAITRQCRNGGCGAWGPVEMTGNLFAGGAGNAWLSCTVPTDLTQAKCDVAAYYGSPSNTLFTCPNIGAAGPTCSNPRPQRYSSGAGAWMSNDFITTTVETAEVFFAADQMVVHFRYRGIDSNKVLVFSDFTFVLPLSNFAFVVSPAQPAPAPELVTASKAKVLTTSQLLAKFFTSDNIQLAQMQGSTVPVRATIGAYTATAITRSCGNGVCGAYGPVEMTGNLFSGGEGNIVLTCSVPADLSQAKCDLTLIYGGNVLMSCPNVGAGGKCTNPRPQRYSSGAGAWMSNDFITTTVEAAEVFFTNDQLAVHFRYRGNDSNKKLVFSDFTLLSTPLTDFGVPPKTNCLSKTTADAVIAAAAAKKGLKSAIVLQKEPVTQLISKAPYKTVEDAVTAIKGIGPRNVVYVSFMWNFSC